MYNIHILNCLKNSNRLFPKWHSTLAAAQQRQSPTTHSVLPPPHSAFSPAAPSAAFHTSAVAAKKGLIPKIPASLKELEVMPEFKSWLEHNDVVYPPSKEDEPLRPAEVVHLRHNVKYSKKKLWYACIMIRGMSVETALKQLTFYNKKGATILKEVIEEAMDMAVKKHNVEYRYNMWITDAYATAGITFRGFRKGRGPIYSPIRFHHANVFLRLREGKPPAHVYEPQMDGHQKVEDYLQVMRKRRIRGAL